MLIYLVEIEPSDWFSLLDEAYKTVEIGANELGGTQFKIKPMALGMKEIKTTARSTGAADALIKNMIIIPEGMTRESVENFVLKGGDARVLNTSLPSGIIEGSGRTYLSATAGYLAQTMEGLDGLLQMPFGCGEQNMIFMAPDVYITEYIKATGQLKPEILAKAEMLMVTGYQRELTYRHNDGSFSAFGESDPSGSLWLTAFVLKVFAQAKGLIYIDDNVLNMAREWFVFHQNQDGSFDPVGFICHNEMVGGINGQKNSLTAFTAIALLEAGEKTGSAKAIAYLETKLAEIDDAYTMSMVSYALELGQSSLRTEAYRRLINMAQEDENGLHWSLASGEIEATSYALLALLAHGDKMTAGQAAKWLVSKRNALGGFSSTQDTVMALEALTQYSKEVKANVDDLTIGIKNESGVEQEISIKQVNFDVLQMVELPVNEQVEIKVLGTGEAVLQLVKRFNLPEPQQLGQAFEINVLYDTTEVPVKAKGAASEAYSYYNPEMKGETLGQDMVVQE